jgi:hypothetical protein
MPWSGERKLHSKDKRCRMGFIPITLSIVTIWYANKGMIYFVHQRSTPTQYATFTVTWNSMLEIRTLSFFPYARGHMEYQQPTIYRAHESCGKLLHCPSKIALCQQWLTGSEHIVHLKTRESLVCKESTSQICHNLDSFWVWKRM